MENYCVVEKVLIFFSNWDQVHACFHAADPRHVSRTMQVKKDKFVSQLEETRGFPRPMTMMIGQKTPPTEFDPLSLFPATHCLEWLGLNFPLYSQKMALLSLQ